MSGRTTLASAVIATVLVAAGLISAGGAPAGAADGCLRGPGREASAGRHWYYRLARQSHRRCWYLAHQGHRIHHAASAQLHPSARMKLLRAIERIRQSEAHAELAAPSYGEQQPDHPNLSGRLGMESSRDGRLRSALEHRASLRGNPVLNSAAGARESAMTIAIEDAMADATSETLPTAANRQPAAQLPADESATGPFRLMFSLLLMAMGFAAVMAGVIFKRADPVPVRELS
jgi:hypothetical protein